MRRWVWLGGGSGRTDYLNAIMQGGGAEAARPEGTNTSIVGEHSIKMATCSSVHATAVTHPQHARTRLRADA
jgi:hypothetical protein